MLQAVAPPLPYFFFFFFFFLFSSVTLTVEFVNRPAWDTNSPQHPGPRYKYNICHFTSVPTVHDWGLRQWAWLYSIIPSPLIESELIISLCLQPTLTRRGRKRANPGLLVWRGRKPRDQHAHISLRTYRQGRKDRNWSAVPLQLQYTCIQATQVLRISCAENASRCYSNTCTHAASATYTV